MHINEGDGVTAGFGDTLIADKPIIMVSAFEGEDSINQFATVHMDFLIGSLSCVGENTAGDFGEDLVIPGKGDTVILLQVIWVQLGAADKGLLHGFLRDHLPVEDGAHLQKLPLKILAPSQSKASEKSTNSPISKLAKPNQKNIM